MTILKRAEVFYPENFKYAEKSDVKDQVMRRGGMHSATIVPIVQIFVKFARGQYATELNYIKTFNSTGCIYTQT